MAGNRGKPAALVVRAETKDDRAARIEKERALKPSDRSLSVYPPSVLDSKVARSMWRRLLKLYSSMQGEIVTSLDFDLLVEYCQVSAEVVDLNSLRAAYEDDLDQLVRLDARVDRKRAHLLKLRESLYLTPRARAGVAPKAAEAEDEPSEFESLLDDVISYVNRPGSAPDGD